MQASVSNKSHWSRGPFENVPGTNGFSLIEILVAVMILSMISATIWVAFSNSLEVQDQTRLRDERIHEASSALDRMARDISMAFLSKNQSLDKRTRTMFLGKHQGNTDRLDFTSFSHLKVMSEAKESDQSEISFFTENIDGVLALMRREDPTLDDDPESGGNRYILLENLESFNLRYFDSRSNNWIEDWDADAITSKDRLPNEVEIKIVYKNHRGNLETLTTRTLITLTEALIQ